MATLKLHLHSLLFLLYGCYHLYSLIWPFLCSLSNVKQYYNNIRSYLIFSAGKKTMALIQLNLFLIVQMQSEILMGTRNLQVSNFFPKKTPAPWNFFDDIVYSSRHYSTKEHATWMKHLCRWRNATILHFSLWRNNWHKNLEKNDENQTEWKHNYH